MVWPDTLRGVGQKSLEDLEKESLRRRARELVDSQFKGNATRAAEAIGVSQPYLSDVLSGKRDGGMKLIRGLRRLLGESAETLLGGTAGTTTLRTVVRDERYPNRLKGAEAAAIVLEIEVDAALKLAPKALQSTEDPEPTWWFDQIRSAHERKKKGLELGVGREITEEDDR